MCQQCDHLQERIQNLRRVSAQRFDPLTAERLTAAIAELEAKKAALHPEQK